MRPPLYVRAILWGWLVGVAVLIVWGLVRIGMAIVG